VVRFSRVHLTFTANGATFEWSVCQAVALLAAVREPLPVDVPAHSFALKDVSVVESVHRLLSDDDVSIARSQVGLGSQLSSPSRELEWATTDRLDSNSLDVSIFPVESLDELLARISFRSVVRMTVSCDF
jgi:hypothetical protein